MKKLEQDNPIILAAQEMQLTIAGDDPSQLRELIAQRVNELIGTDFQKLVAILYRIDVNETRLKRLLQEHKGIDTGFIIADLIIERQREKIRSRQSNSGQHPQGDEEKW
jgi:hypothetical protein